MVKSKLTNVSETMLITLWAKAEETKRADALLHDEKAVEYDFSKFNKAKFSQAGCCVRASLIDAEIRDFLYNHPDAVVIQLGAGIDARYERLHRPSVTHWYDLDIEDAIRLRRQLLSESERNTYITSSMFDYGWTEIVKSHGKPILIIIEGVLMYFEPEKIKAFFRELCTRFDNATIVFDMLAFALVGHSGQHDSLRKVDKDIEAWNPKIKLEKEFYMSKYDHGRFPFVFRMLYKIPYFFRHYNQRVVKLVIKT